MKKTTKKRKVVDFALQETELSPRELAVRFTDQERYFVSESTVYRVLKAHDLITSPAFIVIKASSEIKDKTTAINQLWQTDFMLCGRIIASPRVPLMLKIFWLNVA